MKYFKQDLLTLLISLFVLSGCNENDQIGLDVSPEDRVELKLIDTASIRTTTVKEDTLITSGLSQHPLGLLRDAAIGNTEAILATSLNLPSLGYSFGANVMLDSAVLVLKYGDEFYGDSINTNYTVEVRQLSEKYNTLNSYSNIKTWNAAPAVIGSKSLKKFAIRDSVLIKQLVRGKADITKRTAPHLRIPMNSSFINANFINAASSNFANTNAFQNFIKGLHLSVKTLPGERGGIAFFNLAQADSSRLEIYFRNVSGTSVDTNVVKFNINNSIASSNIIQTYNTAVQAQLSNPTQQFSTVYVQPLGGLRTKIKFPYLNKLREMSNITINKAELVIQVEGGSDAVLEAAPRLTLYRTDIAGQRQEVPDRDVGQTGSFGDQRSLGSAFGGIFDTAKKQYSFTITSYIQDILSGKLTQYDTYIAPLKSNVTSGRGDQTDLRPSGTTAARSILGGGNGTTYKMKLNIIYTKLK